MLVCQHTNTKDIAGQSARAWRGWDFEWEIQLGFWGTQQKRDRRQLYNRGLAGDVRKKNQLGFAVRFPEQRIRKEDWGQWSTSIGARRGCNFGWICNNCLLPAACWWWRQFKTDEFELWNYCDIGQHLAALLATFLLQHKRTLSSCHNHNLGSGFKSLRLKLKLVKIHGSIHTDSGKKVQRHGD